MPDLVYQPNPFAKAYSQWTLVHMGLADIQDLTQKLYDFHAMSMSDPVYQPDPLAKAYSQWTLVHMGLAAIQE